MPLPRRLNKRRETKGINFMTNEELDRALRQLRLGGMADSLEVRAQQARADHLGPIDFIGLLVHDEMNRRRDRLIERRAKSASFWDRKTLDTVDWKFNSSIDRALVYELDTARFIEQRQGLPHFRKSRLRQIASCSRHRHRRHSCRILCLLS
jgi:DNA replication protein DnaC